MTLTSVINCARKNGKSALSAAVFEAMIVPRSLAPTPQEIIAEAKAIHGHFRATFKAVELRRKPRQKKKFGVFIFQGGFRHDHGWAHCREKAYFLRRAAWSLLKRRRDACHPF